MQYKYPEIFWALLLLLIPIFIHLFQLRRFKKTPFTNVQLLKKVVSKSRRSRNLKKWLLLLSRILLLLALIFAFAQPFIAKTSALQTKETVIYLDDSFSMQAKTETGSLLQDAIQELIKSVSAESSISLFTNEKTFKNVKIKSLQNELLGLKPSSKQLSLNEVYLKAATFFEKENSNKHVVLISDFQQLNTSEATASNEKVSYHMIAMQAENLQNVAIDSVYWNKQSNSDNEITVKLSCNQAMESIPVSIYNGDKLMAKTAANFSDNLLATLNFSIPEDEVIAGKIVIVDKGLSYDNQFFFNIDSKEKIKALVIGDANSDFLKRIYTPDEFDFESIAIKNLNYGGIIDNNIIVLNELKTIPSSLVSSLKSFVENNGSLVIIPALNGDLGSYNNLLNNFYSTQLLKQVQNELKISKISFSHPLYKNVFEKKESNFQNPKVNNYFNIKSSAPAILRYQNQDPFLLGLNKVFIFTAPLQIENSNFKKAPLIVPTFYNMARNSLKLPNLYHNLNENTKVDISIQLLKDDILRVVGANTSFIPEQSTFTNKVRLQFQENPNSDGIFKIMNKSNFIRNISFNHLRDESKLKDSQQMIDQFGEQITINELFEKFQKDNSVNELWKWFIILALLFMVIEVLIQKYM